MRIIIAPRQVYQFRLLGARRIQLCQTLELEPANVSPARAKALYAQGHLCYFQGDYVIAPGRYFLYAGMG
ncbi:MAG: hypothetical protein B6D41_08175 [Chloroflexi bacterium UTCFX4]|nr:MAG: hypothetical protein B6D41_08175 [Chloroflexi bacterium UTCFX4]